MHSVHCLEINFENCRCSCGYERMVKQVAERLCNSWKLMFPAEREFQESDEVVIGFLGTRNHASGSIHGNP